LDVQKLARTHTPEAIAALVAALSSPRERVAAAVALLDRGWGRPTQIMAGDGERPLAIEFTWAPALPEPLPVSNPAPLTIDAEAEAEDTEADDGVVVSFRKE
jgi:hypothetical protein